MPLKDFMNSLFKEDIEEDEYEETADTVQSDGNVSTIHTEIEQLSIEPEPVYFKTSQPEPEPEPEPVKTTGRKSSIFAGLDVESVSRESRKPARRKKNEGYQFDRSKVNKGKAGQEEYQAVISPIFGNVEDDKKEFDKVHDAIKLPKPEEDFDMTKVISPMYGSKLPNRQPAESIPSYPRRSQSARPVSDVLETPAGTDNGQSDLFAGDKQK